VFPALNKTGAPDATFLSRHVVEVIETCGGRTGDDSYLNQLSAVDFQVMKGYLKGFIDLVFVHRGRWYIVDYKSNHLGDRMADYGPANLQSAMAKHHYYLQYLLYTVALHRYLKFRMQNYDYRTHFGKVYYLFLRGMSPYYNPGHGVFQDRPTSGLIEALSSLFEKGDA
jgi:exodeoxyribonuclease V beta subunit